MATENPWYAEDDTVLLLDPKEEEELLKKEDSIKKDLKKKKKNLTIEFGPSKGGFKPKLPQKATEGSACYDVFADIRKDGKPWTIPPHATREIFTGLCFQYVPPGYHGKLFIRSGICKDKHLCLANSTGIIDGDYTGPITALIKNDSNSLAKIEGNERFAQILFEKEIPVELKFVQNKRQKTGNHTGFGSTGSGAL